MAEYLPGTTGERISELREGAGLTIEELALKVGVNATTLGRMEKGQTQKIGDDVLTALAREFNVSTDFLLGLTSIPDRKNYDIAELGLSAQAARNLYTRKVNADVVNHLLEHPRFAVLTAMIAQYLDETFAAGVAVQNQYLSSMSDILLGIGRNESEQSAAAKEAVRAFNLSKVPPHQVELLFVGDVLGDVLQTTIQRRAQFVQRLCFHVVVGSQPPDCLAVNAAFFSQQICRNALLLHHNLQFIKDDHILTPS